MSRTIKAIALAVLVVFIQTPDLHAQKNLSKWQVGINGGLLVYQGDLTPTDIGSYKTVQPVFGLNISRVLNPSLLLRTNLAVGKLYGNDAVYNKPEWRKERNYTFNTPVTEIAELLVWNILGSNGNELGQRFAPYVFGGMGVSLFKINRDTSNFNAHYFASHTNVVNGLRADMSRATPRSALVIPLGMGMEFYLTPKLSLTAEVNFRYTFTDYIDGFSLGANPGSKDFYHSHTVGLLYRFGKGNQLGCPPVKR